MVKVSIFSGNILIAKIIDREVVLEDDLSLAGQLVRSIVHLGVPIPAEEREGRWRIQVEDPDFVEKFAAHIEQYGLTLKS